MDRITTLVLALGLLAGLMCFFDTSTTALGLSLFLCAAFGALAIVLLTMTNGMAGDHR